MNNTSIRVFCGVSCLWIVAWPFLKLLQYDDSESLTAHFRHGLSIETAFVLCFCLPIACGTTRRHSVLCSMAVQWTDFFQRNAPQIYRHAHLKPNPYANDITGMSFSLTKLPLL
jgi:hypothetical protein